MFRCVLQAKDGTYYVFDDATPSANLQEALCFEDRSDAEWEKSTNPLFKNGKIIPVILQEDGSAVPYPTMYLVVSYKPTKFDYCRNCLMGTYEAKHEMKVFHNEEDIVEHCAQLDSTLEQLDTHYRHWIVTQDELGNGQCSFDYNGKLPTHLAEKVTARTEQLKKGK
jgi:hypothetical protein